MSRTRSPRPGWTTSRPRPGSRARGGGPADDPPGRAVPRRRGETAGPEDPPHVCQGGGAPDRVRGVPRDPRARAVRRDRGHAEPPPLGRPGVVAGFAADPAHQPPSGAGRAARDQPGLRVPRPAILAGPGRRGVAAFGPLPIADPLPDRRRPRQVRDDDRAPVGPRPAVRAGAEPRPGPGGRLGGPARSRRGVEPDGDDVGPADGRRRRHAARADGPPGPDGPRSEQGDPPARWSPADPARGAGAARPVRPRRDDGGVLVGVHRRGPRPLGRAGRRCGADGPGGRRRVPGAGAAPGPIGAVFRRRAGRPGTGRRGRGQPADAPHPDHAAMPDRSGRRHSCPPRSPARPSSWCRRRRSPCGTARSSRWRSASRLSSATAGSCSSARWWTGRTSPASRTGRGDPASISTGRCWTGPRWSSAAACRSARAWMPRALASWRCPGSPSRRPSPPRHGWSCRRRPGSSCAEAMRRGPRPRPTRGRNRSGRLTGPHSRKDRPPRDCPSSSGPWRWSRSRCRNWWSLAC